MPPRQWKTNTHNSINVKERYMIHVVVFVCHLDRWQHQICVNSVCSFSDTLCYTCTATCLVILLENENLCEVFWILSIWNKYIFVIFGTLFSYLMIWWHHVFCEKTMEFASQVLSEKWEWVAERSRVTFFNERDLWWTIF